MKTVPAILLLESQPELRKMLAQLLREWRYEVFPAAHPQEALSVLLVRRGRFTFIVTSARFPSDISGIDFLRHALESYPAIQAIVSTGGLLRLDDEAWLNSRQIPILLKPYSPASLQQTLAKVLAQRALEKKTEPPVRQAEFAPLRLPAKLLDLLETLPAPALAVDSAFRVHLANRAACAAVGSHLETSRNQRLGDFFGCLNRRPEPGRTVCTADCFDCALRNALNAAMHGLPVHSQHVVWHFALPQAATARWSTITAEPLILEKQPFALLVLQRAATSVEIDWAEFYSRMAEFQFLSH